MSDSAAGALRPLRLRDQLNLSCLWFSLNFQSAALLPIVIPAQVLLLVTPGRVASPEQAAVIGWLAALSGAAALLVPVIGALSDRTASSLGRRRPYVAAGGAVMLLGLAGLIRPAGLPAFLGGLVLLQLGGNICTAGYQGLIPDRVPAHQRGTASGFMGAMTLLGSAASLAVAALLMGSATSSGSASGADGYYVLTGIVLVLALAVTLVGVGEEPGRTWASSGGLPRSGWRDPWRSRAFRWVFVSRALVMLGLGFFMTFVEYYFATVAGVGDFVQATAWLALLALLAGVGGALLLGLVADRASKVRIVFVASGMMAMAALAFVLAPTGVTLWPLGLLFGLGYGAYVSVDWALAIDSLPSAGEFGRDMGLWSLSSNLPAIVAPLLGSGAIALAARSGNVQVGYRAIFVLAALSLLAGALSVLRIRPGVAGVLQPRPMSGAAWRLLHLGRAGGGRAWGVLTFWTWWEASYVRRHRIRAVRTGGVLRYSLARHRGAPILLAAGTRIVPGDLVLELHLENRALSGPGRPALEAWGVMEAVSADLDALAARLEEPAMAEVKALHGVTMLAPAGRRLGFEVRPLTVGPRAALARFFMVGLVAIHHRRGWVAARAQSRRWPGELWLSREAALARIASDRGRSSADPTGPGPAASAREPGRGGAG